MEEASSSETLSDLYEKAHSLYINIKSSSLETNANEFLEMVERCRCRFEHLTLLVSRADVFSTNETFDELPSSSIQFLCIPALLAELTVKRRSHQNKITANSEQESKSCSNELPDRLTLLRLAKVYLRDFLTRCKDYAITDEEIPSDETDKDEKNPSLPTGGRPTPQQLHAMGCEREKKIKLYKEAKELEKKISELKVALETADEETRREYYSSVVKQYIYSSFEELRALKMEEEMLERMEKQKPEKHQASNVDMSSTASKNGSFKPFLITRDAAQKAVYGMGYPSLPVMSVDEFYDKRVREGWFPGGGSSNGSGMEASGGSGSVVVEHGSAGFGAEVEEPRPDDEQNSDDEDSEEKRARLVDRDEYRDMHRRGWGNTYNRS